MEKVSYEKIRDRVNTGDIILFSGKGGISAGIKWFTGSKWSHVGMALKLPGWDVILIWESTTLSKLKDMESGEERQGVQLVPLSERLEKYDGDACIRFLDKKITKKMHKKLADLRQELKNRPYEENKIELIKSAYDGFLGDNEEDLSSLFCSELVAEAYQRIGLLPEDIPSNEYTPKDFSAKDEKLNLLKNAVLSEEVYVYN